MTFGDPTAFLAKARERRKVMFRSRCEIRRPNAEREFDPATGTYNDPGHTVIYAGVCQLKPRSSVTPTSIEHPGSGEVAAGGYLLALPWDAPDIDPSDHVVITESDDQAAVGRGPWAVGWQEYGDSRTHRAVALLAQDRPAVNDA